MVALFINIRFGNYHVLEVAQPHNIPCRLARSADCCPPRKPDFFVFRLLELSSDTHINSLQKLYIFSTLSLFLLH